MLDSLTSSLRNTVLGFGTSMALNVIPFTLQDVKEFPFTEYTENLDRYREALSWFTGDALQPGKGEDPDVSLYPIRINPIMGTCLKHAYALYGETNDDGRPLVLPKFVLDEPDSQRDLARRGEMALYMLWWENFGRAMMFQNGLTSQIFGGSIYFLREAPYDKWRNIPMRIERIAPENFIGFLEPGDPFRLRESWTCIPMTYRDAAAYGVEIEMNTPAYWVEHWTLDKVTVTINEHPVVYQRDGADFRGETPNPYGFIPGVYIPHMRAGGIYGLNNIDHLKGLVREINLRMGDLGDAVNSDSHGYVSVKNIQGTPKTYRVDSINILDLGGSTAITGNEPEPDAKEIRPSSASEPMNRFVDNLIAQYRRDASVPAVADGEDEGSQRSAATLVARMWPLTSHIKTERYFQTAGLDWLTVMAVRMMKRRGIGGINEGHLAMRTSQEWAPVLPKDREEVVNEIVNRMAADAMSLESAIEKAGDIEDPTTEVKRIKDFMEFKSEMKQKEQPVYPNQANASGGTASKGSPNRSGAQKSS